MKRLTFSLLILLFSLKTYANTIKLPEVVFPIEVISQILEEKPIIQPPQELDFRPLYDELKIKEYLPLEKPYSVKLPYLKIQKPTSYLGVPPSNALLSDSIDYFEKGDFIFAQENLKKFIEKYKDNKNLFYAYYLLGYISFESQNYKESTQYLEKSCNLNPLKENCLSYAVALINIGKLDEANTILNNIYEDEDIRFYKYVLNSLKGNISQTKIECNNVDIGSVNYCQYFLKHTLFLIENYKESLKYNYNGENKKLKKIVKILDGFNYYFLKDYEKSKEIFKSYLNNFLSNDNLSNLAYLGLALTHKKMKDYAEILETRDSYLSYYLYLNVINSYASDKNWLDTFAYIQKVLNLIDKNKDNLRFDLAVSLYNLKNYDYALNIFHDLAKEKNDEISYLYCGLSAYAKKDYKKSQECLSKITQTKDTNIEKTSLIYLSEIYYILNDEENYINTISQLRELDENLAYDYLGWYFFKNKDYQNAYKSFKDPYMKAVSAFNSEEIEKAEELIKNKSDRKSIFLSAYIDIKRNDLASARLKLKKVADGYDDLLAKKAHYLYAYLYFSEGDFQQALKEFDNFIKRFKDDDIYTKKAYLRIADSYYNLGEYDIARNMYKEFIEKNKGKKEAIDAAYSLVLLETKGESDERDKVLEDFISKYPDYPLINTLKLQLASVYEEKGEIEKALKIYQQIEDNLAKYKMAEIYFKSNQTEKAKDILLNLVNTDDKDIKFQSNLLLGQIYENQGNIEDAIKVYKNISDNDDIKFKLANLLIDVDNYDEALGYLNQLLEKFPDKASEISFYIGKIKYKQNLYDEAISYLESGIKSQNYIIASESHFLLGEIYNIKKDFNKALNSYLNAIYTNPQLNDTTAKARLKAAEILIKAEKRKEASCLISPLIDYNNEEIKKVAKEKFKNLPKCLR